MFSSVGIFRTSSLGDSISSNPERTAPRRQGGKPDFIELLQQRTGSPNPGINPRSPALQADSLPAEPPGKTHLIMNHMY